MTIIEKLKTHALAYGKENNLVLEDFGVSASCVYAIVSGKGKSAIGVALLPHGEGDFGPLLGKNIEEVFDFSLSYNALQRAFALSLINALGQHALSFDMSTPTLGTRQLLPQKLLEMTQMGDEIVFIGNLEPVIAKLTSEGRKPIVFCRQKNRLGKEVFSDIFEYEALQKSSIAVITGAALIGSTIDAIINMSPKNAIRIMAGFSCGAHPSWFKDTGITHVASMKLELPLKKALLNNAWDEVFNYPGYFWEV